MPKYPWGDLGPHGCDSGGDPPVKIFWVTDAAEVRPAAMAVTPVAGVPGQASSWWPTTSADTPIWAIFMSRIPLGKDPPVGAVEAEHTAKPSTTPLRRIAELVAEYVPRLIPSTQTGIDFLASIQATTAATSSLYCTLIR